MALSGTLKDFGIADILQLIGQQQKTGKLRLQNGDEEVEIIFSSGSTLLIEFQRFKWRVGAPAARTARAGKR